MSKTISVNGSCLCGKVSITAAALDPHVGACHCKTCRKWGGGPLVSANGGTEVSIVGDENISVYSSSDWAERGFCKHCGTHLFYRVKEDQSYHIPAGLFEGAAFELTHEIFVDQKTSYISFVGETKKMTGAEVFAMFAPPA